MAISHATDAVVVWMYCCFAACHSNSRERGRRGTVPWRSQKIEIHWTPEVWGYPAKIHYLDYWNSLSGPCHTLPWLVYSIMKKKDTVKTVIFEKSIWSFFALSNLPFKINISKIKFCFIFMIVFGHWPNFEAEYVIFLILNLNFRGVPSIFQGIVRG